MSGDYRNFLAFELDMSSSTAAFTFVYKFLVKYTVPLGEVIF